MSAIDKIISKFNKAKSAINSLKGIQAKIQSINYTSAIDALGEQAEEAKNQLERRGQRLQKSLTSKDQAQSFVNKLPAQKEQQIIYPYHDALANYIVFNIRPRNNKGIGGGADGEARGGENSIGGGNENHPVFKERSIALYVPDTLISQANVQYRQEGMKSMAKAIADVFENGGENIGGNANTVLTEMAFKGLQSLTGGLAGLKAGIAVNPKNEQILDGIPFRSWDFTFDFYPKSEKEALEIRRIIYAFRSSMLPDTGSLKVNRNISVEHNSSTEVDEAGNNPGVNIVIKDAQGTRKGAEGFEESLFTIDDNGIQNMFLYPNIFDIQFVGPLAKNIDGFLPAVCTNAQVDYSGGQKFSTHQDGMPTKIQLTLNFLEIKIMTLNNYDYIAARSLSSSELLKDYGVQTPSELDKIHERGATQKEFGAGKYFDLDSDYTSEADFSEAEIKRNAGLANEPIYEVEKKEGT